MGRSDATLNAGGVRIGSAEIYAVLDTIPQISDSLVTTIPRNQYDETIILFIQCEPGVTLDVDLKKTIPKNIKPGKILMLFPKIFMSFQIFPIR